MLKLVNVFCKFFFISFSFRRSSHDCSIYLTMKLKTLKSCACLFFLQLSSWFYLASSQTFPLESWTLSSTSLPRADRNQFTAYNEDSYYSDCIWIWGGNDAHTLWCYNLTNNSIQTWDTMDSSLVSYTRQVTPQASLIITDGNTDLLYFIEDNGYIIKYNLNTKNFTSLTGVLASAGYRYPCMI